MWSSFSNLVIACNNWNKKNNRQQKALLERSEIKIIDKIEHRSVISPGQTFRTGRPCQWQRAQQQLQCFRHQPLLCNDVNYFCQITFDFGSSYLEYYISSLQKICFVTSREVHTKKQLHPGFAVPEAIFILCKAMRLGQDLLRGRLFLAWTEFNIVSR